MKKRFFYAISIFTFAFLGCNEQSSTREKLSVNKQNLDSFSERFISQNLEVETSSVGAHRNRRSFSIPLKFQLPLSYRKESSLEIVEVKVCVKMKGRSHVTTLKSYRAASLLRLLKGRHKLRIKSPSIATMIKIPKIGFFEGDYELHVMMRERKTKHTDTLKIKFSRKRLDSLSLIEEKSKKIKENPVAKKRLAAYRLEVSKLKGLSTSEKSRKEWMLRRKILMGIKEAQKTASSDSNQVQ